MFGPDDFEMQIQQEEVPGVQPEPAIPPAQDEQYGDFIVKHGQNTESDYENRPDVEFTPVNEMFGILYVPLNEIGPLEIVPSVDENGHGTAMAGLAAGNFAPVENFSGAALKATIIAVKLKTAKSYLQKGAVREEQMDYPNPGWGYGRPDLYHTFEVI